MLSFTTPHLTIVTIQQNTYAYIFVLFITNSMNEWIPIYPASTSVHTLNLIAVKVNLNSLICKLRNEATINVIIKYEMFISCLQSRYMLHLYSLQDSQKPESDPTFKEIASSTFARCQALWNKQSPCSAGTAERTDDKWTLCLQTKPSKLFTVYLVYFISQCGASY